MIHLTLLPLVLAAFFAGKRAGMRRAARVIAIVRAGQHSESN